MSADLRAGADLCRALRLCKAELGQNRESLGLWIIYARLERQKGNWRSARTVYSNVVDSPVARSSTHSLTGEVIELWAEWAMMEMELDAQDRCREVLLRRVDGGPTGERMRSSRRQC